MFRGICCLHCHNRCHGDTLSPEGWLTAQQ